MARMHSHKRGQSGSTRPSEPKNPSWVSTNGKEIEMLVLKHAKEGKNAAQIGLFLRDDHGIPSVKLATGKSIGEILAEKDIVPEIPDDLMALIRKVVFIKKHLEENHKDMTAKRGLILTESKVNRLIRYYKKSRRIPADWTYDADRIKLYVE
jgi:small subunit ribosomal protein S15